MEESAPRRAASPRALLEAWRSRGWPLSLLERAQELRLTRDTIESWIEHGGASLGAIERGEPSESVAWQRHAGNPGQR